MKVAVERILANPYRDMDKYPIDQLKVDALVESINQTDFWDNLLARPAGNVIDGMSGKELAKHLKTLDEADFDVELGYGHHRWAAVQEVGLEFIDIPVKVIEDEIMLQIMANENKGDWGFGNMAVILETVRQVRNTLHGQATEFDEYEDYMEKYSFFTTEKAWKAAKKVEGVGYRRVHAFLGETWRENDIRSALAVLKAIDDGEFLQEQIIHMPSVGIMNQFQILAKAIREQEAFPPYFQDRFVSEASSIITDEAMGATVKIVKRAASATKKGNDPIAYLTKQKINAFDLAKSLFKIVSDDDEELEVDAIVETDGLKDFEDMDEAVEKVKELITKAEQKSESAEGEGEAEEPGADEVEEAIAEAQGELDEADGAIPTPAGEASLIELAATFVTSSGSFIAQMDRLKGTFGDMDSSTADRFGTAYESTFITLVQLGLEAYGAADLKDMMERAESAM